MRIPFILTAALAAASLLLHPHTDFDARAELAGIAAVAPARAALAAVPPTTVPPPTAAAPATTAAPAPEPAPAAAPATAPAAPPKGVLPFGAGMWIWMPEMVEDGDKLATIARAKAAGLTHLYVKTGSSWQGLINTWYLDGLLPLAHAAGLRVYGWDFPNLEDVNNDVARALGAIWYTTPSGDRLDGFTPDIETPAEGTWLSPESAALYVNGLRGNVGWDYPLIATVPRPSEYNVGFYPFAEVIAPMDAVAPMVYWLNREPDSDVAGAVVWLSQFGKPVMPIGQAYDGAPEGGRPGPPTYDEIKRFIKTAGHYGAAAVSFWSWQHASDEDWLAIQQEGPYNNATVAPYGLRPVPGPPPIEPPGH